MTDLIIAHIAAVTTVKHPKRKECDECVKIGGAGFDLRTCQECSATLCCDNSPNRTRTSSDHATRHPVVASAESMRFVVLLSRHHNFAEYDVANR